MMIEMCITSMQFASIHEAQLAEYKYLACSALRMYILLQEHIIICNIKYMFSKLDPRAIVNPLDIFDPI